jgi:hypothetical protein
MQDLFSVLGVAALALASLNFILALVILVLHEARYIVRLSRTLCAGKDGGHPDQAEELPELEEASTAPGSR